MVAFFKRPAPEDALDARIAVLSRRGQPLADATASAAVPAPVPNIVPGAAPDTAPAAEPAPRQTAPAPQIVSEEDRFLLAREELLARLTGELSPERISILSRGELARVVDAAV